MRLCVLALVVLALAARSAAAGGGPSALPDCLGKPTVRPASIVLACGDGNFGLRSLRWIGWGSARAAATGTVYANDCKPFCAAGHFHTYRGVIVVDGAQRCGARTEYRRLTVAFVGPTPYAKAKAADLVYPLRCT